jgi:hypothetical protein
VAERVLASAAFAGEEHPEWESAEYFEEAQAVLGEIRAKLRIRPDDRSPSARARVDQELSKIIDATFLGDAEYKRAMDRAGRDALLSAGAYQIEFTDTFKKDFKPLGERNNPIKRMIVNADDQQHLFIPTPPSVHVDEGDDQKELSLFVRRCRVDVRKEHWAVIQTHRSGSKLIVQAIWRLLPHIIDTSKANQPLDLLHLFVEHYGLEVSVCGKPAKFTESAIVRRPEFTFGTGPDADVVTPARAFTVFNTRTFHAAGITVLANVYSIDMSAYAADLRDFLGTTLV